MLDDPFKYGLLIALAIALLFAGFTDLRSRKIDNWLNAGIALAAPLFWLASDLSLLPTGASLFTPSSVVIQLAVAAGTFAVLTALFAFGAMGGGDVKLLGALSLWIAPWPFFKLVIMMALIGGVLTILFAAWHTMRRQRDKLAIPYGVAIAVAGLWTLSTSYMPVTATAGSLG